MTYWILPASGIPISCGTVHRLMVLEEQTSEWKARISAFGEGLEQKFNANSSEIIGPQLKKLSNVDSETILDLESDDKYFLIGFEKLINDESIRDIEDLVTNIETVVDDPYLNMDFGISRGK